MIVHPLFATLWSIVLAGVFAAAPAGSVVVKVQTVSGQQIEGNWVGVTDQAIEIESDSTPQQVAIDNLLSLRPVATAESNGGPVIHVALSNGSSIAAQQLSWDEGTIQIEPRRQSVIAMPVDQVRSIRFRPGTAATDPQWLGLVEKDHRNDVMVIRRDNDQLDPIGGVVVGLDNDKLLFELDGDKIEAPLARLEGVVFRSTAAANTSPPVKVTDIYGSVFLSSRLEPSESVEAIEIRLPGQVTHQIKMDQIRSITWAGGRVMLSSESPAESEMTPYLSTKVPTKLIADWFGPHADGEDLVTSAGGSVEYRVGAGFETLAGSVGRDQGVDVGGAVLIKILVDDQVQWEQTLADSTPMGFRIPVANARRVRLEVLPGDDGDVGDQVRFSKPRLIK
ncbi:NPCBM/NEW2 domain-containing protein [Stieleria sp. TO1_6]|uniref:NPCBM/NEW2 domain-containing protein n=1 Tax=Stieleria tagensis TaxID=2956795 RepID=UPI00209B32BE|nr:NPCBM/NEW2 domain-containing protein [Stieleria tagensis]MCO8120201.1 NPCBM/NEW2 domain-containing protein [Stieleria tagensis]